MKALNLKIMETNVNGQDTEEIVAEVQTIKTKEKAKPTLRDSKHKRHKKNNRKADELKRGRGRKERPYPLVQFEECLNFAKSIYDLGSSQKIRRLTLFDKLEKSPESSASRSLIINSNKYGLIKGSISSEFIELSTDGFNIFKEDSSEFDKHFNKLTLAITNIKIFKFLYDKLVGNKLPNQTIIIDILKGEYKEVQPEDVNTIVDLFIVNTKYLKLLKLISGAERLVTFEFCLEEFSKSLSGKNFSSSLSNGSSTSFTSNTETNQTSNLEEVCFYVTPIGEENSEERKHSDLFLGSIVEPALDTLNIKVVRADQIGKPGTITKQIIEYLAKAKLVIADLSFNNPNVFYELCLRHAFRLPTVQIIRKGDRIPFDLQNSRTIPIDTTDIYSLVPKIDTYRAEIANQVRQALNDPDSVDNPLTVVYPNIKLTI
jgi:hypothetical protein